jgi:NAD dependent epimerase/dehydratase family enzyme
MKIVIPGGSGQVGHILARYFHARGHAVTVFSRSPRPAPWRVVGWDGRTPGDWTADLEQSDVCINLAGRSVDCRYTAANRRGIIDSRIESTRLLNEVVACLNHTPRLWVNASTATIYRHALDRAMSEADGLPNDDFMRALRDAWGIRAGLPTARWMIEIGTFLMRTESELVLKSRRVVPGRLLDAGFQFLFPEWPEAARELVARWRESTR